MIRTLCLSLAAAAVLGCASTSTGSMSGDIYEMRLAIQNLQDVTQQQMDDMNTQFANLRASDQQQIDQLRAQINMLQEGIQQLIDQTATAQSSQVTRTVILPSDSARVPVPGTATPAPTVTAPPTVPTPAPVAPRATTITGAQTAPQQPASTTIQPYFPPGAPQSPAPGQPLYYQGPR